MQSNPTSNERMGACERHDEKLDGTFIVDEAHCALCTIQRLRAAATLAVSELETVEREIRGIAPEAVSKALPLLRAALSGDSPCAEAATPVGWVSSLNAQLFTASWEEARLWIKAIPVYKHPPADETPGDGRG